jgi:hypothetical protein
MLTSRYPSARWRGPVPNDTPRGMLQLLYGFVMHSEQGTEAGTNVWFHEPRSQVSAHLGFPKPGHPDQWVDFDTRAWAEAAGNSRWISGEFEGHTSEPLTNAQMRDAAEFYAWAHRADPVGFPFRTSESPTEAGFGWHGMGGVPWGGHIGCPGDVRKAQRPLILAQALVLVHPTPATIPRRTTVPGGPPAYPGLLHIGDAGPAVYAVQEQLRARGWRVGNNSIYDAHTAAAVAEFQADKNLRVDGVVGPVVWWSLWHLPIT